MQTISKVFIVASVLLIGVFSFSSAFPANAQTVNPGGPNQPCYALNTNLVRGTSSQDVFNLQTILIKENLLHISEPTNYFGNLTFAAVVAFQEKYNSEILTPNGLIHGTGFVGPLTREELNALYGCVTPTNPIAGPGQSCGGNIANPPVCEAGYYCAPVANSNLPFGDVGGTCIVNPTTGQSPVISGISGPTRLSIGQTGTWTISANDPQNGTLSYSVIWGDEVLYPQMTTNGSSSITYTQTTTFTHVYSGAGNYTPVFYVKDNSGNTATSSISVNVGNSNVAQPTVNYLQPNSGVVGSSVTIVGNGFTSTGNRIVFGNLGVENNPSYSLNSSNGTTITFTVPYSGYTACLNSIPACMIAERMIQPGSYNVSVVNNNGTSNQIPFTVISSTTCTPNWTCGWTPCTNGEQGMTAIDSNNCGLPESGQIACPALARLCN